jgi:hypothetical protein
MPALPRIVSVLLGITLATPVVAPSIAVAAPSELPGEEATEATRLNAEAQQKFAEGDYADAARTYARILEVLPENRVNREERDNTLLIALEVYREAYKQARVDGDEAANRRAAELLCVAQTHYKTYEENYRDVYGGGADPSKAALESYAELEKLLGEAEAALGSSPCAPPPPEVVPEKKPPPVLGPSMAEPPRGPSGVGLIVAGAITLTAGVGATSMIIVGGINRRKAKEIRDDEESTDSERSNAKDNIKRADGLIIAGSVVSGVLIAGGATMLGIGVRRRLRYLAFSPTFDRGYVGLGVQGRF